jgi:cyclic pyranopterin phosphate synthase
MPEEGVSPISHEQVLRYEEIVKLVKIATELGINKIRITGGEPLVRKDLVSFIALLREIDEIEDISLTTNGIFLERYLDNLISAGLNRINISLDSKITRRGNLDDVIRGLKKAIKSSIRPIKINVVLIKNLNDNLKDFAKLSIKEPVHIRFIEYMPVMGIERIRGLTEEEMLNELNKYGELEETKKPFGYGPAIYYKYKNAKGTIGLICSNSHNFCYKCNRLRLTSDGKLKPCLFGEEEVDVRSLLRTNASNNALKEAFKNAIYLKPRDRSRNKRILHMYQIGG